MKDTDSADRFLADNGLDGDGNVTPGSSLKNLSYLELPLDHTTGFTPQGPTNVFGLTPRAQVADNDAAVGKVISALSKSSYWPNTAVFVVEDDSQDGPDHVDGHRNVLLVASPYARQRSANDCYGGYISHTHQDQAGVLRTIELMLGLPALSTYDQNAAPLYDLFQNKSTAAELTEADLAPYEVAPPAPFQGEKVGDPSAGSPSDQQSLIEQSRGLNLSQLDVAGPQLETVLWKSVKGVAAPLPPGLDRALSGAGRETESEATDAVSLDRQRAQAARFALAASSTTAADGCAPTVSAAPSASVPEVGRAVALPLLAVAVGAGLILASRRRKEI